MGGQQNVETRSKKKHAHLIGEKCESDEDIEDLDEDQIMEIFKEEGIFKRDNNEFNEQSLYLIAIDGKTVEIECE
jgi:Fe2+ or Zn2+ uptake regulation protein